MSIPISHILRVVPGNNHIQFRCDIHCLSRSRKHQMYKLNTPSRLKSTPNLHIIGASGNDYEMHVTPTSVFCSWPDQHQACKHILFLLHQTLSIYCRGKDLFIHPPTLIEKVNSGKMLKSKFISPLANNLCVCAHDANCQLCYLLVCYYLPLFRSHFIITILTKAKFKISDILISSLLHPPK
jgi:hypothetical protein